MLKGKRLRGALLLLVYDSFSAGENRYEALDLACAIELAHSASLILDDMLDEDVERRGLPTIHLKKGHKKAMLDVIGILSVPYTIVSKYNIKYAKELSQVQRVMSFGVMKELFKPDLPATKLYDIIITAKTGLLFGLATGWGYSASCYQYYNPLREKIIEYGIHTGKAMQIADDISDIKSIIDGNKTKKFGSEILLLKCMNIDRLIKEFFKDLKEGKLSKKKIKELWSNKAIYKTMEQILEKEIDAARDMVFYHITPKYVDYDQTLLDAPYSIAKIMLNADADVDADDVNG